MQTRHTPLLFLLLTLTACQPPATRTTVPTPPPTLVTDYGLHFQLSNDWSGFTLLHQQWTSQRYNPTTDQDVPAGTGPLLLIRHPLWKPDAPCQDIPILVFIPDQWNARSQDGIFAGGIVSAFARTPHYIFATWSRFNWDESLPGRDQAAAIITQNTQPHPPR